MEIGVKVSPRLVLVRLFQQTASRSVGPWCPRPSPGTLREFPMRFALCAGPGVRFEAGGTRMPRVTFDIHTILPPEQVLAMLIDFSARRPELWPMLARQLYEVYEVGTTSAAVKEGSIQPTLMWERDYYNWSQPGRVLDGAGEQLLRSVRHCFLFVRCVACPHPRMPSSAIAPAPVSTRRPPVCLILP